MSEIESFKWESEERNEERNRAASECDSRALYLDRRPYPQEGDRAMLDCSYPDVPVSDAGETEGRIACVHIRIDNSQFPVIRRIRNYRIDFGTSGAWFEPAAIRSWRRPIP